MDTSILIVSWNTREVLDECLTSIEADSHDMEIETIVVDNHSADGSAEMVREKHPAVALIANDENRGFAAANIQAFEKAKGRYILMLNSDTAIRPGALRSLVAFMDEHEEAGAATCRLINPDGTDQHSIRGFPSFAAAFYQFTALRFLGVGRKQYKAYRNKHFRFDEMQEVDSPMGAAILFRRTALDAVGFLDPAYFMYYEEVDICRRLRDAGHKIYFLPDAVILHHGGCSARQDRARLSPIRLDSMMTYFRKHEGPAKTLAFKLAFYPLMFLRALIEVPLHLFSAILYATIKRNSYKARRSADLLRGKCLQLVGSSEARAVALLFLFALVIRLATSVLTACVSRDAGTYLGIARNIQDRAFACVTETRQHPLFPILLAGFQMLFGRSIFGAQVFCSLLSALTVVPLYFLSRDIFDRSTAALAAGIFAIHSVIVCNTADVVTEPTYLLMYVTSIWLGLRALQHSSWGCFAGAGAASGLAYLTRPEGLGAMMIIAGWAALLAILRIKRDGRRLIPGLAVLVAAAAIAVLPYSRAIDWRLTPKKSVGELIAMEENEPRVPGETVPNKSFFAKMGYNLQRMGQYAGTLLDTAHAWLLLLPFALLRRRTIQWKGFGEIYLASAAGFNLFLCYAVIVVFGYLSARHLLVGVVLLMPWMAVGVREVLAGLDQEKALRRLLSAAGAVLLVLVTCSMIAESFHPRRRSRAGSRTAGRWIAQNLPDRKVYGLLLPRVGLYARTDYCELQNLFGYSLRRSQGDVVKNIREQDGGVVVMDLDVARRVIPEYQLDSFLNDKGLKERFSCEAEKGSGAKNIVVFEVLPRNSDG